MIKVNDAYFDGRIVKRVRKAKGITQKELAARIGSFFYTVSWIERNKFEPGRELIEAIGEVLGLRVEDFYTETKPSVSPKRPANIGQAVQQARLAAGLDQATLAGRIGGRPGIFISHIETNFRRPSRKMAKTIAEAIGLAPETFWEFLPVAPEMDVNVPAKNIGEAIRKARIRRGLTQYQLYRATGVSVDSMSRAENHFTCPRNGSLVRLATYLGEDVDTFLRLARLAKIKRRVAKFAIPIPAQAGAPGPEEPPDDDGPGVLLGQEVQPVQLVAP